MRLPAGTGQPESTLRLGRLGRDLRVEQAVTLVGEHRLDVGDASNEHEQHAGGSQRLVADDPQVSRVIGRHTGHVTEG